MTVHTPHRIGCGSLRGRRTPVVVCVAAIGASVLLTGCGQSIRDDHARIQASVIEAKQGDGNLIASAMWTGENIASEDRQSRVASAETPESDSSH